MGSVGEVASASLEDIITCCTKSTFTGPGRRRLSRQLTGETWMGIDNDKSMSVMGAINR